MSNPFYTPSTLSVGLCKKRKTWCAEYSFDTNHGYTIYNRVDEVTDGFVTINELITYTDDRKVRIRTFTRTVVVACKIFNTMYSVIIPEFEFDKLWTVHNV